MCISYNTILLGNEYTQSCASPDIAEAIFQTGGTSQVCEWLNDGIDGDSVCYCKTNECNTIEILASWIQNGGVCKFLLIFIILYPANICHNIKAETIEIAEQLFYTCFTNSCFHSKYLETIGIHRYHRHLLMLCIALKSHLFYNEIIMSYLKVHN